MAKAKKTAAKATGRVRFDRDPQVIAATIQAAGAIVAASIGKGQTTLDPVMESDAVAAAVYELASGMLNRLQHYAGG